MKPLCPAILAATLAASLGAQSVIATPVGLGLETIEGDDQLAMGWHAGFTLFWGAYANARNQYIDGELMDNKLRVIKSLAFRHEYTNYSTSNGTGRSWSNVQLTVADTNYTTISSTFAANLTSPTAMFSGSVTWPSMTGNPPSKPAPLVAALTIPFSTVRIHTGQTALVSDLLYTGGTLAAGTWGTASNYYYLDGCFCADNMYTGAYVHPSADNGCNDTAVTVTTGATMVSGYNQFSKANTSKPNIVEIPLRSRFTAPNATVLWGVGLKGFTTGVPIGAACNGLHLDFSIPVIVIGMSAGPLPNAETTQFYGTGPRNAANLAAEIWAQGAWADSSTNAFSLTRATQAKAPNLGMTDVPPKKRLLYVNNNVTSTTGSLTPEISSYNHPISFYGL